MNTLSISIHDPSNLGDQVCNPCDYFGALKEIPKVNAWDLNWIYEPDNLLIGGGGMIHGLLEHLIRRVNRTPHRKLIAWGLGHNRDGASEMDDYKDVLDGFDLVGVRDFKSAEKHGWDYVPCASCLHPAFEGPQKEPSHEFVVYQHHGNVIRLSGFPVPVLTWSNDAESMDSVLEFLSRGETVITNSYHGAYWAQLLGRRVLLYKPFSSRFCDFKHPIASCDETTWHKEPTPAPEGFLEECRDLNRRFYEKVKITLEIQ